MDFDGRHSGGTARDQLFALCDAEQRRFSFVFEDGDEESIEETRAATDDVEVSVGERVERTGVDCHAHRDDGSMRHVVNVLTIVGWPRKIPAIRVCELVE